jgi:hypothetical protein
MHLFILRFIAAVSLFDFAPEKKSFEATFSGSRSFLFSNRVARFFWVKNTKMGTKYTKCPQRVPNGRKTDQMATKYNKGP